jgi:hypothetical protein
MRVLVAVFAVVTGVPALSCASRVAVLIPAQQLAVASPAEGERACIERLLARSRMTGYIEETVDKEMAFFRVRAREVFANPSSGRGRRPKVPRDTELAVIAFYNVQCSGPDTALVTPMNANGALDERWMMTWAQAHELWNFAARIGVLLTPPPKELLQR